MPATSALIVAAGLGVRMGARGQLSPKGMIALDGLTLARASVMHLASRGVDQVRIVTGHLADIYRQEFSATDGVELIHNGDYHASGSLKSLLTGLEGLSGDVIILESDIMYEARALDPLTKGTTGLVVSGATHAGDEVYVWANTDGQLLDMSKNGAYRAADHFGELVGVSSVASGDLDAFRATGHRILADNVKADYEDCLVAHAADNPFATHLIPDLIWAEVDDEDMLAHAYKHVWPHASAGLIERRKAM
ncbi:MAG: NTP transferase domain-containing protein [Pseudooceanicola sp.]